MSGRAALAAAARFERDHRAERYPQKIREGADAEALCLDYQCWVAIAEWLETDRFASFADGADPEREPSVTVGEDGRTIESPPIVRWPELEAAAHRALATATARCDRRFTRDEVERGEYEAACSRRASLWAIHRAVQLRRQTIDAINAELRERRQQEIAA